MASTTSDFTSNSSHSPRSSGFPGDGLNSPQFGRNARSSLSSPWANIVRGESSESSAVAAPSSPHCFSLPKNSASQVSEKIIPEVSISDCSLPVILKASLSSNTDNNNSYSGMTTEAAQQQQQPESSSDNANSNVAAPSPPRVKKPAWNKPSNGTTVDVGPVMGASSWPALSESTTTNRAAPKSSSTSTDSSSKPLLISQGPVAASSSSSQKQVTNNANPNSARNQAFPTRQKSMKRGGSGPANGGFTGSQSTSPSQFPSASASVEMPHKNFSGKTGSMVPDSFPRDPSHKINSWESGTRGGGFMPQPHIGNDHHHHQQQQQQLNSSFKRGNGGSHPRGDGSYQQNQNFVGRREHDRDWNPYRSFNGRDVQQQQRVVNARNFIRTPRPGTGPFITPQPVRPFGNAIGFPEVYFVSGEPVGGFVYAHPPAMPIPSLEPNLRSRLATQIDYYFSSENLCKDIYLRQNMDEQGWVPISLIAGFNRVKKLTNNIQFITDTVRTSTIIEIQGDRIRKRNDWMNWPLPPPPNKFAPVPGSRSTCVSDYDMLANRIQSVELEEGKATNHYYTNRTDPYTKSGLSRSSSGELNNQPQTSNGEGTSQVTVQAGSDRSISTRS